MKDIFFIGKFPPPYGGATIKNDVLYKSINKYVNVIKFDTTELESGILGYVKLIKFLISNRTQKGIISIASYSLFKLSLIIYIFNKNIIRNISVFIVGGAFDELIKDRYIKIFNNFKNIYVESNTMKVNLNKKGLTNVSVIPNLRCKDENIEFKESKSEEILNIVYLGRICEEKGIFNILDAANLLKKANIDFNLDFFGPIDNKLETEFLRVINNNNRIEYKGIFRVDKDNVYNLLNKYDISLYPTTWKGEGIPGTIIESKLSGVSVLCSNWKNNDELVIHMKDGIVMNENSVNCLYDNIKLLSEDRKLLNKLKYNSLKSSEKYVIENYINDILANM